MGLRAPGSQGVADPIVLSLGSIDVDFQMRVEQRRGVSETLLGSDFLRAGGGKGADVALVARRLGRPAALVARLGADELAEIALAPLRDHGVDLSRVGVLDEQATGVSMVTVPPDGRKGIVLAANANRRWEAGGEARARDAVAGAPEGSVLVVDCEVPDAVALAAVEAARARGLRVVLDPSPADRVTDGLLSHAHHAVPNAGEAAALTGVEVEGPPSAPEAARRLAGRGVRAPVVKLPGGGCVALSDGRATPMPAADVEVVDTDGAGDAFAGALAVALLEGAPLARAAAFACAAAGGSSASARSGSSAWPRPASPRSASRSRPRGGPGGSSCAPGSTEASATRTCGAARPAGATTS